MQLLRVQSSLASFDFSKVSKRLLVIVDTCDLNAGR